MKKFLFLLKFSYRNLFRAPKRTMIMLVSLILGTTFIIWDLNFSKSGSNEVIKGFLVQYAGRYQITGHGYYDLKNTKMFDNYKTLTDADIADPSIFANSTRRVTLPAFVSGEKKTLGALLSGIDVPQEKKLSKLSNALSEGKFLSPKGNNEIIMGKRLAEKLGVKLGDQVAVIGQALDGSVANELLTVVGLLDFGGGDLEDSLAFTQIKSAQTMLAMSPDQYHQRVSFDMNVTELPKLPKVQQHHWDDIIPEVGVSVEFVDSFTWVVACIIVLVISLGLANTIMITFFEREKEFISLNIIGAQMSWITKSLLVEVFIIGFIGIVSGCILGHLATLLCGIYPINLEVFTNGQPIIMGGMVIKPLVRFFPNYDFYWKVPLMISMILSLTMAYPLYRVVQRSRNAV
jgi:ABC-type lipoprotein release transport system permease subunit